jgi:hypothetical protein
VVSLAAHGPGLQLFDWTVWRLILRRAQWFGFASGVDLGAPGR